MSKKTHLISVNVEYSHDFDTVYAVSMTVSYQLFSACVWSNGCEGEDAIVQGSWVVVVLQNRTKEL